SDAFVLRRRKKEDVFCSAGKAAATRRWREVTATLVGRSNGDAAMGSSNGDAAVGSAVCAVSIDFLPREPERGREEKSERGR
ncbi:hypothetical protein SOVF_129710, partial [Spinacia oleracea]